MLDTPETIHQTINKIMEIDEETEEKYKDMDFSYLDDDDDEADEADEEIDDSGESDS